MLLKLVRLTACLLLAVAGLPAVAANAAPLSPGKVDLTRASLAVDDFSGHAAARWDGVASVGPAPSLTYSGQTMTIGWSGAADPMTYGAHRAITGVDWSGYQKLRVALRATDLVDNPTITLTGTDGSSYRARFPGPHTRISATRAGWLQLEADLAPAGRELLARISDITVSATPTQYEKSGSLSIGPIDLVGSRGFYGPSAFVDPTLSTYAGRNWTDVATRIHEQGFTSVHLTVLHFDQDFSGIVGALHQAGLPVALNIYPTTNFEAYAAHPDWRQVSLGGEGAFSWRVYLSPTNQDFVQWLHGQITRLMSTYAFDGFTLDEPWYEVWGGPYHDNPSHADYMDISSSARDAFKMQYGYDPVPALFLKDSDDVYYLDPAKAQSTQYKQWVQFRIDTINQFMAGLATTARATAPGLPVFLTYVSDARVPGGYGKAPEYQAQDLSSMQTAVHPAGVIFESAWQDWEQPGLAPNYILDYTKAYVPQLQPGVVGLGQPDVGSLIKRNMSWLKEFSADSWQGGFAGYVIYEWSIGDWPTGGPPL